VIAIITLVCATALALAVFAVRELAMGAAQNRAVYEITALDQAEARASRLTSRADTRLRRTRLGTYLMLRIAQAGLSLTALQLLGIVVGAALGAYLLLGLVMPPLFAAAAAAFAVFGVSAFLRRKQAQRVEEFVGQLPEVARVLSNASSAGLALRTAIAMAADELREPAAGEMRRVADALAVGQPTEAALGDLQRRLPSRELGVLVQTLIISSRAGGSLITALRNLADTLEGRKELRREVRTVLAQPVFTGYVVIALGVGSPVLLNLIRPGSLSALLNHGLGRVILVVAFLLFFVGALLVRRITRIET